MTVRDFYIYCLAFGLEDRKLLIREPCDSKEVVVNRDDIKQKDGYILLERIPV